MTEYEDICHVCGDTWEGMGECQDCGEPTCSDCVNDDGVCCADESDDHPGLAEGVSENLGSALPMVQGPIREVDDDER